MAWQVKGKEEIKQLNSRAAFPFQLYLHIKLIVLAIKLGIFPSASADYMGTFMINVKFGSPVQQWSMKRLIFILLCGFLVPNPMCAVITSALQ